MGHLKAKVGVRGVKAMELYTTLNHLHCYNEHVLISNLEKKKNNLIKFFVLSHSKK